jgi:ribosomal protein L24
MSDIRATEIKAMKSCKTYIRILSALAYAFTGGFLQAADIHVTPSGNDATGNGSTTKPYREIRKALERIKPGDTVLVTDGQYAGFTLQNLKANKEHQVTIKAQGQKAEVLKTSDRRDNRDSIYIDGCSYIVVDGLHSFNANRAAVRIEGSDHVTIRNGVFGNNGNWGIFTGHCDDLLIENNDCYGSVKEHGIYVGNSGDRPVIRGNRTHGNAGCGIHMNADLGCGGDGIISGAIVENNVVYDNGRKGGGGINMDGVQDSQIRNNLLFNNHATGITCFRINGAAGPKGLKISNNTIIMASDARYALQFGQTSGLNTVRNNILYNLNPIRGGLAYFNAAADVPNVDSAYNIFSKEAPMVAVNDWKTRYNLSQWQNMGHEKNSFVSSQSELFAEPSAKDYRLKKGSPAIGKGDKLETNTAKDIGCSKYPGT